MKPTTFLSFDVEALPGRAEKNHVDSLIWGKLDGREYGIRRICKVLRDYQIKGNFLIDLSGCALYGDKVIAEVGNYLLGEGHELHVHLHSEWLIRSWGIKGNFNGPPGLSQLDEDTNQFLMKYSFFKFYQLFGKNPEVFRAGGFSFNNHTVTAARDAGFRCLSNFNSQRHEKNFEIGDLGANNEPFSWGGGLVELPVDFSPEPLSSDKKTYNGWFDRVAERKKTKTFNLVLHSWSLLRREKEFFDKSAPDHEVRLREMCEHLQENSVIRGYSEYLADHYAPQTSINRIRFDIAKLDQKQKIARCNICYANFILRETDVCPGCGSRARHRQIVDAFQKIGNPFAKKRVLTCFANSVEKASILKDAIEVRNFDVRPLAEVDFQMDIQCMDQIDDDCFDGFVAIHVLNHVRDDRAALKEIHRILVPGGTALITVPYRLDEITVELNDTFEHYGIENFNKYGVGSYRRYGLESVTEMFSEGFESRVIDGFDSVTEQSMKIFLLTKPTN